MSKTVKNHLELANNAINEVVKTYNISQDNIDRYTELVNTNEQIKRYRESGLTFGSIADLTDRSVTAVWLRYNSILKRAEG